jgi:hypothetical protein
VRQNCICSTSVNQLTYGTNRSTRYTSHTTQIRPGSEIAAITKTSIAEKNHVIHFLCRKTKSQQDTVNCHDHLRQRNEAAASEDSPSDKVGEAAVHLPAEMTVCHLLARCRCLALHLVVILLWLVPGMHKAYISYLFIRQY